MNKFRGFFESLKLVQQRICSQREKVRKSLKILQGIIRWESSLSTLKNSKSNSLAFLTPQPDFLAVCQACSQKQLVKKLCGMVIEGMRQIEK